MSSSVVASLGQPSATPSRRYSACWWRPAQGRPSAQHQRRRTTPTQRPSNPGSAQASPPEHLGSGHPNPKPAKHPKTPPTARGAPAAPGPSPTLATPLQSPATTPAKTKSAFVMTSALHSQLAPLAPTQHPQQRQQEQPRQRQQEQPQQHQQEHPKR